MLPLKSLAGNLVVVHLHILDYTAVLDQGQVHPRFA